LQSWQILFFVLIFIFSLKMVSFFNPFLSIIIELSQRTDVMSGKGDIRHTFTDASQQAASLHMALAKGIEMFTCFIKTKIDIDLRKRHFRVTPFLFII